MLNKIIFVLSFTFLFLCQFIFGQHKNHSTYFTNKLNPKRSEIVLNGAWLFQPALNTKSQLIDESKWDSIQVPSSWTSNYLLDSSLKKNQRNYLLDTLSKAWYQTQVNIPLSWKNNATIIHLEKVSTDAVVYVNNNMAGTINWYSGSIDISSHIKYGKVNQIKILVIATANEGEIPVLMGTATTQVSFTKASLATKGIIGNVSLISRPKNHYISDVFVKPSVRKKSIDIETELVGLTKSGKASIKADFYNSNGEIEKSFQSMIDVVKKDTQLINVSYRWDNPRIWDLDKPELYTLKLSVIAKNMVDDVYNQEFGFREFWVDGKDFYLNGSKINLRPHLLVGGNGMDELIDASIDGIRKNGFNISEIWPNNFDERGFLEHSERIMDRADKKGFLIMGVSLPFVEYLLDKTWSYQWDKPEVKLAYEKRMLINLKKDRNHPSVVMWTTSGNFFGDSQDQNPLNIGKVNWIKNKPTFQKYANAGLEAINLVKRHDPTRPVFTHHGTYVGDVHTLNFYLNFIPLQEREEWMSEYAKSGQIPFIGIEFGTPLFCDFLRGRNGYGSNIKTEPLITEFSAMYLGNKAYLKEPLNYKKFIATNFIHDQTYKPIDASFIEPIWSFQELQKLFITNTWRSWRTYHVSGGLLAWSNAHGWQNTKQASELVASKPFEAGRKGFYYPKVNLSDLFDKQAPAYQILEAGKALISNNNETLAYIAGSNEAFTEKNHQFKASQEVRKQLFFFNDTREEQLCNWECQVWVGDKEIFKKEGKTSIEIGDKKTEEIDFILPNTSSFKTDGKIILWAKIAANIHRDTLSFRIFKNIESLTNSNVSIFDPEGKTKNMLHSMGYKTNDWHGESNIPFLVIGRNALSKGFQLPADIEMFVKRGGRLLSFNQQDSLLEKSGFRVAKYVSRYVFPVGKNEITKDLDELDLRNWNGVGTMNTAYPDYMNVDFDKTPDESPMYGWHWGNRGSVATNAVEKPHHSGWTPLLECEFDMAYSPLMELNFGKGKIVWCSLDIEDHYDTDPVAEIIMKRLINYIQTSKIKPRNQSTIFVGNEAESVILKQMGLNFQSKVSVSPSTELVICGSLNENQKKQVLDYITNGGKVLVLPKSNDNKIFGVEYYLDNSFEGGKDIIDWDITKGLSISDIRYRTSKPSYLLKSGCDINLNGLLGKKNIGKGQVVFCQIDPERFNADSLTYYRFTRWRSTRALTQVLANLGASFITDENIFKKEHQTINSIALDRTVWKAKMTIKMPAVSDYNNKHKDLGISKEALELVKFDANESTFIETNVPMTVNDTFFNEMQEYDGEAVFRKTIDIPESMLGKDLILNLSVIDDFDDTYFNGEKVGATTNATPETWNFNRSYIVPSRLVKKGKNVLAIRAFDWFGGGGLLNGSQKREISLKPQDIIKPNSLYHLDYRTDFELGDNPFRYFRW